jgi:hypothetical protein
MRGRLWLVLGAVVGIAIAGGHVPYLAGAARSLAETAERLVGSGATRLIDAAASAGAPQRVILGVAGVIAVLLPGVTALLLVLAARGSLRLRAIVALLVVVLGAASFAYQSHGRATGVLLLALVIASLAVMVTGPLVAAPLAALAGLIAGEYLPTLVSSTRAVTQRSVNDLHQAIYNHPGTPTGLQIVLLIVAAIPFALAARLIVFR